MDENQKEQDRYAHVQILKAIVNGEAIPLSDALALGREMRAMTDQNTPTEEGGENNDSADAQQSSKSTGNRKSRPHLVNLCAALDKIAMRGVTSEESNESIDGIAWMRNNPEKCIEELRDSDNGGNDTLPIRVLIIAYAIKAQIGLQRTNDILRNYRYTTLYVRNVADLALMYTLKTQKDAEYACDLYKRCCEAYEDALAASPKSNVQPDLRDDPFAVGISLSSLEEYLERGREVVNKEGDKQSKQLTKYLANRFDRCKTEDDLLELVRKNVNIFSTVNERTRRELIRLLYNYSRAVLDTGDRELQKTVFMKLDAVQNTVGKKCLKLRDEILNRTSNKRNGTTVNNLTPLQKYQIHQYFSYLRGFFNPYDNGKILDMVFLGVEDVLAYLGSVDEQQRNGIINELQEWTDTIRLGAPEKKNDGERKPLKIKLETFFRDLDESFNRTFNQAFLVQYVPGDDNVAREKRMSDSVRRCVKGKGDISRGVFIAMALYIFKLTSSISYTHFIDAAWIPNLRSINAHIEACGWPQITQMSERKEDKFALGVLNQKEDYSSGDFDFARDIDTAFGDIFLPNEITMPTQEGRTRDALIAKNDRK